MAETAYTSSYSMSYTSFSGADIVATFDGVVIGGLQAISYSVTREKVPIYTMGSADPRSFSRGKRGIAGSMVFTVFDRDTLLALKEKANIAGPQTVKGLAEIYANVDPNHASGGISLLNPDEWETKMQNAVGANGFILDDKLKGGGITAMYADQIPPFDINITFRNEYGQAATLSILGVELLNEGSGMSIDDIVTEKACTFVARGLTHLATKSLK